LTAASNTPPITNLAAIYGFDLLQAGSREEQEVIYHQRKSRPFPRITLKSDEEAMSRRSQNQKDRSARKTKNGR